METLKHVSPYRTAGVRHRDDVYHDRADCPTGQLIHSDELASGTGRRPLCDQCQRLAEEEREPQ